VWELPLAEDGVARRLVETEARVDQPQISPDGRWLAYCSDETGAWEVYLAPFRRDGERVRVSPEGGCQPRWRGDGRELYYVTQQGQLLAVPVVETPPAVEVGLPRALFQIGVGNPVINEYAVTRDGQRFLAITPIEDSGWSVQVVLNWPTLLKR
jgi:hypothetical protein